MSSIESNHTNGKRTRRSFCSYRFGKLPTSVIVSGAAKEMSRAECLVYMALVAHSDGRSGVVKGISHEAIAELTDLHRGTVARATRSLARKRLIELKVLRGRGRTNLYRILPGVDRDCATSDVENNATKTNGKLRAIVAKTVRSCAAPPESQNSESGSRRSEGRAAATLPREWPQASAWWESLNDSDKTRLIDRWNSSKLGRHCPYVSGGKASRSIVASLWNQAGSPQRAHGPECSHAQGAGPSDGAPTGLRQVDRTTFLHTRLESSKQSTPPSSEKNTT